MMRRPATRLALALPVLAAAWSLMLGGTLSAYTASTSTSAGSFAAAADWLAPTASTAVIGRTTAYDTGFIARGGTYYVYANVGDTGNPASGTSSVSANLNSISPGKTAVALTAGTYSAGGVSYGFRSAPQTASSTLSVGTYAFGITSTDTATNSGTQSFNTTVDDTGPAATDVQTTNVTGGTVGHLDQGDTLTLTFAQPIDPYSVVAGWNGSAYTNVQLALADGGRTTGDAIYVYSGGASPVALPLGPVSLNSTGYLKTGAGSYVTYGGVGATTPTTMTRNGASITFTLGTPNSTTSTSTTPAAMTWFGYPPVTDIAGNAVVIATATQSGTLRLNF